MNSHIKNFMLCLTFTFLAFNVYHVSTYPLCLYQVELLINPKNFLSFSFCLRGDIAFSVPSYEFHRSLPLSPQGSLLYASHLFSQYSPLELNVSWIFFCYGSCKIILQLHAYYLMYLIDEYEDTLIWHLCSLSV